MPVRIQLGASRISITEGRTFFVTSPSGEVDSQEEQGFFAEDTRLMSRYRIRIGRWRWQLVSSAPLTHYSARFHFVNPGLETAEGVVRRNSLGLRVERTIRGGVHEDLDITNYGLRPALFPLSVDVGADFADLFEVRGLQTRRNRVVSPVWREGDGEASLTWIYEREDFRRGLTVRVAKADSPPTYAQGRLHFHVTLQPRERWHACLYLIPILDDQVIEPDHRCSHTISEEFERLRQGWFERLARLETPNDDVRHIYRQAVEDITVLRISPHDEYTVVAAGIPWFATLFGRDSLIIGLQTLLLTKQFAPAILESLGRLQAATVDDWRDAQPGKIPHEIRHGELAHFHEVPHTPYYGTADATILYPILLHETYRWLGDIDLVRRFLPVADRCLHWIDHYGDLDGDGFQEYKRRSLRGIEHQGWKDSELAVVHGDGSRVEPPVALVELQGYVYDAKRRMAELYEALGEGPRAEALRAEAAELRRRFQAAFWFPRERTYVFGLDGAKRPIETVVSNAGHTLWSGIAGREEAARVVRRLMRSDMFAGWGIRTLSADHPAFNPFSYQLGAVWPHDNGIIAAGFKRYGFVEEAQQVAAAICDAASHFQAYHLPELYAGLPRTPNSFPVQYRGANIPQGWAAGTIFMLLQTLLGLRPDAAHRRLFVDPTLPPWLSSVTLHRLRVGAARFDLRAWRENGRNRIEVDLHEGSLEVIEHPQQPEEI